MTNYKLRLFTPRSSYGAKEMAPKSQLCACSFQDSLRQKNWALEQIRKFPDTINRFEYAACGTRKFSYPQKNICGKKFPDTCAQSQTVRCKDTGTGWFPNKGSYCDRQFSNNRLKYFYSYAGSLVPSKTLFRNYFIEKIKAMGFV